MIQVAKQAANAGLTAQIVNPMIESTSEVFGSMLDVKIERKGLHLKSPEMPFFDITAVIGLSGEVSGAICVSFKKETALKTVKALVDLDFDDLDPLVVDSVGEFANVIAGTAKHKLNHLRLAIGLPNIVTGKDVQIQFPSGSQPMCLDFSSELGEFMIAFGFSQ